MKISKFLLGFGLLAAMGLVACSEDAPKSDVSDNGEKVYMSFKVNTAGVSRSTTEASDTDKDDYVNSSDGKEIASEFENTVNNVKIFFVDADDHVIAQALSVTANSDKTAYTATFKEAALLDYASKDINVMVYCNFADDYAVNLTKEGQSWGVSDESYFQMSNATTNFVRTLPASFKPYNKESTPFSLGTIKVERAAARIDLWADKNTGNAGKFTIASELNESGEESNQTTLTIEKFALINMANKWYATRRVSDNTDGINPVIGGLELGGENGNFVVDWDWAAKNSFDGTSYEGLSFSYPMGTPSEWTWSTWDNIENADNDNSWNSDNSKGNYYIWRYLNENTIPQVNQQKKGITTGVVFKAKLESVESGIAADMAAHKTLYVFQNTLIGSWERVLALRADNIALDIACEKAVDGDGNVVATQAADAGFTAYSYNATDDGYYVLYYYWIRHNDNSNNTIMGQMEFSIVRNNVYKLKVTKINKYGHPENPDDPDPDPEVPDDPDEEEEIYFQVNLQVLPWTVRINDIEF